MERLERLLQGRIRRSVPLRGGCIAQAARVEFTDGRTFFCKTMPQSEILLREAAGLRALAATRTVAVPGVILAEPGLLVLDFVEPARTASRAQERALGRTLAWLHRLPQEAFGFTEDNFLGSSPQKNTPACPFEPADPTGGWARFFLEYRIRFQLRLAERHGLATPELRRACDDLAACLEPLLATAREAPCLLHGDLWGGNFLPGADGEAYVIDPACSWGHREADLAMTELFGGFSEDFYKSYQEHYPLVPGYRDRAEVYRLYHLFNHLNLFGTAYYGQVMTTLRGILRAAQTVR